MKTKKSAQDLTHDCQNNQQDNLYQPGMYWVEVTDHGVGKDQAGVSSLWLEILPIGRDLGYEVPKKGRNRVVSVSEIRRKPDPLAPYRDKRRVWLKDNGCEYDGVETNPIRIRADVLLHSTLDPKSTDPHGLTGAHLKFECGHPVIDGRKIERWLLQGPKQIFRMDQYYN